MPTKTAVRAFCAAIRNGELDEVRAQLAADPELAHTTVSAPPKNDDGQSPLQIAFKTGRYDAAELLVAAGADVNHMERESVNAWRTPVLHDAIRGCMLSNEPERALAWVERLLELGRTQTGATRSETPPSTGPCWTLDRSFTSAIAGRAFHRWSQRSSVTAPTFKRPTHDVLLE